MRGLAYLFVVALPGSIAAAVWTLALRLAGSPGSQLARISILGGSSGFRVLGLLLSVIGQLYAALAFTALIVRSTAHHTPDMATWARWLTWGVSLVVATAPPLIAALDWARQPSKATQCLAARITWPLTIVGALLFALYPAALRLGWAWVPRV